MAHQGQGPASAAMARSISPDWSSGLPPELLESISRGHLASGTDAASFRSVCSPWRAAVPFAPCFAPLLLLPSGAAAVTLYSVAEDKSFSVPLPDGVGKVPCGSSCGWLALMDEVASVTLFNPFTAGVVKLPPVDEEIPLSSSTFVFKKDGRWVFHPDEDDEYVNAAAAAAADDDIDAVTLGELRQVFFQEIVLSSPPDAGGCVAMAVLRSSTEVAYCRVGVDTAWTLVETNLDCSVDSIVFCQGRFVAIDCTGEISIFSGDIATLPAGTPPTATPMPSLTPPVGLCHRSYVESNGELYVVGAMVNVFRWAQRFDYNTVVYKCSNILEQEPAWSRVNDAGDLTLFVSMDFRYGFAGTSVSGLKRNGVYFSEPLYGDQYDLAHSMEIADIATGISEVKTFHPKMQGLDALGWFRPNLWRGGERTSNDNNENQAGPVPPEAQPESS
ncbi:hypothetical protein HU200_010362 [Digitaria exilis]|uniref:KIB1-4 beta-propeller domain-containing protein n=1 Tax=Digitaria exilis TaxID=1010633 RepID=A0A835KRQ2_9POAL|nr:hypothetical protein HU200_010362 [Digitaria exilis]